MKLPFKHHLLIYSSFFLFSVSLFMGSASFAEGSRNPGDFCMAVLFAFALVAYGIDRIAACEQYLKSIDQTTKEQKELLESALQTAKEQKELFERALPKKKAPAPVSQEAVPVPPRVDSSK